MPAPFDENKEANFQLSRPLPQFPVWSGWAGGGGGGAGGPSCDEDKWSKRATGGDEEARRRRGGRENVKMRRRRERETRRLGDKTLQRYLTMNTHTHTHTHVQHCVTRLTEWSPALGGPDVICSSQIRFFLKKPVYRQKKRGLDQSNQYSFIPRSCSERGVMRRAGIYCLPTACGKRTSQRFLSELTPWATAACLTPHVQSLKVSEGGGGGGRQRVGG